MQNVRAHLHTIILTKTNFDLFSQVILNSIKKINYFVKLRKQFIMHVRTSVHSDCNEKSFITVNIYFFFSLIKTEYMFSKEHVLTGMLIILIYFCKT